MMMFSSRVAAGGVAVGGHSKRELQRAVKKRARERDTGRKEVREKRERRERDPEQNFKGWAPRAHQLRTNKQFLK